jgi:hypothetical protein
MGINTKICYVCGEEKSLQSFGKYYSRENQSDNLRRNICEFCRKDRLYAKFRYFFFKEFDFKCQCCGESDIRFLTLEHVQQDGYKDRGLSPIQLYRKAFEEKYDRSKWSCLCWNCNCATNHHKICPHKSDVSKESYLEQFKNYSEKIQGKNVIQIPCITDPTKLSDEEAKNLLKYLASKGAL